MKKIAYIEVDTHAEIASHFLQLTKDSKLFEVHYFFSEKIKDLIGENCPNIHVVDSSQIIEELKKSADWNLVLIGTAHRYFNVWNQIQKMYPTAVVVHNLNFSKATKIQLFTSIVKGDLLFRTKLWLKEGLSLAPQLYDVVERKLVLDKSLSREIGNTFLPLFYTQKFVQTTSIKCTIVIPGNVSQKRRDYQRIFKVIRENIARFPQKFRFIFLGKAEGKELIELTKLKIEQKDATEILYFDHKLSTKDFDNYLSHADLLWCPIQEETSFMGIQEFYGRTKMTGNIGDAIKFGKVAVFPKGYATEDAFIIEEENDVLAQFIRLKQFSNPDIFIPFAKENVQKKLEDVLESLVNAFI